MVFASAICFHLDSDMTKHLFGREHTALAIATSILLMWRMSADTHYDFVVPYHLGLPTVAMNPFDGFDVGADFQGVELAEPAHDDLAVVELNAFSHFTSAAHPRHVLGSDELKRPHTHLDFVQAL